MKKETKITMLQIAIIFGPIQVLAIIGWLFNIIPIQVVCMIPICLGFLVFIYIAVLLLFLLLQSTERLAVKILEKKE